MTDKILLPEHIGIIMDGNGRWAKKRGLPRNAGHKKGAEVFENVSRCCRDLGIKYLTQFTLDCRFSQINLLQSWKYAFITNIFLKKFLMHLKHAISFL